MNAVEFFRSDEVSLPLTRKENDFEKYLAGVFDRYVAHVKGMTAGDQITDAIQKNANTIESSCTLVNEAVQQYLRGLPHKAYAKLTEAIKFLRPRHFDHMLNPGLGDAGLFKELYRIRIEKDGKGWSWEKKDLFHVPFEGRHKVSRQRYSIPGLPCLYLGGTLYISWEEMDRPAFHSTYVARFEVAEDQQLNMLTYSHPIYAAQYISDNPSAVTMQEIFSAIVAQGVCWPIIAACSVKRKHEDAPFIAEYVVPQLLLQWVTEEAAFDGIAYFSVKRDRYFGLPGSCDNYVFPTKIFAAEGHCSHLGKKFVMTEPQAWQLLERTPVKAGPLAACRNAEQPIEVLKGQTKQLYRTTPFGQLEGKLLQLPVSAL
jgi:hypothetical protein